MYGCLLKKVLKVRIDSNINFLEDWFWLNASSDNSKEVPLFVEHSTENSIDLEKLMQQMVFVSHANKYSETINSIV